MNLVELNELMECRKLLDKITPNSSEGQTELKRVKDILDDMLEFKIFPNLRPEAMNPLCRNLNQNLPYNER